MVERIPEGCIIEKAEKDFSFYFDFFEPEKGLGLYEVTDILNNFKQSDFMLKTVQQITGDTHLKNCYAALTRYTPNSFLKIHDDNFSGDYGERKLAFVLHLTPE